MNNGQTRVLFLTASARIGGGSRCLLMLWEGLRDLGLDCCVLCPGEGPMVEATRQAGFWCEIAPFDHPDRRKPWHSVNAYRRIVAVMRDRRIALVHTNDLAGARAVALPAARCRVPVVSHIRFPPAPADVAWAFRGLPKPSLFILASDALAARSGPLLRNEAPRAEQRRIYDAVDLDRFRIVARPARRVQRVGIVANVLRIKQHEIVIAAAGLLAQRGVDLEVWVVGDDTRDAAYRALLDAQVAALGLSDRVLFLGFQADVPRVLAELDVVVSASQWESLGTSLIEAMASGLPVVAPAVGGLPEVVADGETGILVTPNDARAMADALQVLLADHALRQRMGRCGRVRAQRFFGRPAHAAAVLAVYDRLLRSRRGDAGREPLPAHP